MTERVVHAAGGVVWRPAGDAAEVVLVHRRRYDDWSLPKGKLTDGEHPLLGAVREVFEETGVYGVPQVRLPATRYLTGVPGVEKSVQYWSMRLAETVPFTPNDEVDEVRWLVSTEAAGMLTYGHDRGVLAAFTALPPVTGELVLVRHASAGDSDTWPGPDDRRPLDVPGRADAEALADLLSVFRPDRVVSASPDRCLATVAPLAARYGLPVEIDGRLDEGAADRQAVAALRTLAADGGTTVVCGQGETIPPVLAELAGSPDPRRFATEKGDGWVVAVGPAGPVGIDLLELHPDPAPPD